MKTPVLNNHLKCQYVLLGNRADVLRVVEDLKEQGETAKYCCCVDYQDERFLTIDQCISLCLSDKSITVWNVSDDCESYIERLEENGINVTKFEDMFLGVGDRACHYEEMYIDRYGTVHCCCKTYLGNIIGSLKDPDIYTKIVNFSPENNCVCAKGRLSSVQQLDTPISPELVSIELSSLCNACCTYCFQNDEKKGTRYNYYDELSKLIFDLDVNKLIFAGGEILIQQESIEFLRRLKSFKPELWIHLKSNGCHEIEKISIVEEIFDSITITLNGFGASTVATIMNVSFEKTKAFCEKISENEDLLVGIKFLTSPANICELPEFLDWCFRLHPDRIIVPSARIYECNEKLSNEWLGSTFSGLNMAYWKPIFARIGSRVKKIIKKNIRSNVKIQIDNELQGLLGISEEVMEYKYGK